ncbi:SpoIIE family protein phosphatase [Tunturibacter psychrotolerans]|uniref:SpoIIE family protein phosphatase n=1 Tax=Tunturiibacter psychrotolerans TaxID=3069686 RepID=A0AAU7ZL92_9BACT
MAFLRSSKSTAEQKQQVQFEEVKTTGLLNLVVVLAVVSVAYTDWIVVANVSLGYLYVLPIALSAFINPLPITIGLAVLGTILSEFFGPVGDTTNVRITRFIISLAGFLIVAFLVSLIAKQRARLAAEVRRQRDEYESDLLLAAQVQRQVLPKAPIVPGLELAAFMQTARLLGGDYYDFFQISDEIVDVVIADVSGKGAAASLLMPSLAVALRLRAHELSGPAAILKDLDECLKQITRPATFVTMFYARFNTKLRTLEYANGGHNPPLLLRPQTGESLLLENAGPIMGILPSAEFSNTLINLKANDVITLFTDGVTEQENESEEQFSLDRLKSLVLSEENKPATTLVTDISEAVASFAGTKEQEDDLTVVIVKVL